MAIIDAFKFDDNINNELKKVVHYGKEIGENKIMTRQPGVLWQTRHSTAISRENPVWLMTLSSLHNI